MTLFINQGSRAISSDSPYSRGLIFGAFPDDPGWPLRKDIGTGSITTYQGHLDGRPMTFGNETTSSQTPRVENLEVGGVVGPMFVTSTENSAHQPYCIFDDNIFRHELTAATIFTRVRMRRIQGGEAHFGEVIDRSAGSYLWIDSNNSDPEFQLDDGTTNVNISETVFQYATDTWYSVAGVWDGNTAYLWVNDEMHVSGAAALDPIVVTSAELWRGSPANSRFRTVGYMREFCVWDRALERSEIAEISDVTYRFPRTKRFFLPTLDDSAETEAGIAVGSTTRPGFDGALNDKLLFSWNGRPGGLPVNVDTTAPSASFESQSAGYLVGDTGLSPFEVKRTDGSPAWNIRPMGRSGRVMLSSYDGNNEGVWSRATASDVANYDLNEFTAFARFRIRKAQPTGGSSKSCVFGLGNDYVGEDTRNTFEIRIRGQDLEPTWGIRTFVSGNANGGVVPLDEWCCVAFSVEEGKQESWLNGELVGSDTEAIGEAFSQTGEFCLGGLPHRYDELVGTTSLVDGDISDVGFWARALSAEELQQLTLPKVAPSQSARFYMPAEYEIPEATTIVIGSSKPGIPNGLRSGLVWSWNGQGKTLPGYRQDVATLQDTEYECGYIGRHRVVGVRSGLGSGTPRMSYSDRHQRSAMRFSNTNRSGYFEVLDVEEADVAYDEATWLVRCYPWADTASQATYPFAFGHSNLNQGESMLGVSGSDPSDLWRVSARTTGGTAYATGGSYAVDQWQTIVGRFTYTNSSLKLYVNGVEEGTAGIGNPLDTRGTRIRFGKRDSTTHSFYNFRGLVSDAMVWDYAMEPELIRIISQPGFRLDEAVGFPLQTVAGPAPPPAPSGRVPYEYFYNMAGGYSHV